MRRTIVLLLAAALVPAAAHADQWDKTYSVHGQPQVVVGTDDGNVEVRPGPAGRVTVHVTARDWRIRDGRLRIEERQDGDRIEITVREPHLHWNFSWGNQGVLVEVTVPRELDLTVRTGDGNVSASGLSGQLALGSGDGNLDARDLKGDITLGTGDGRILASGLDGRLDVHTGDGRVEVDGRFRELHAGSGDGSVTVEALEGSEVAAPWLLRSGDGPLVLRLPEGFRADLDAHTGDGPIHLDLPVEVTGRLGGDHHNLRGRLHGGGGLVRLVTGDGSIRIASR